MISKHQRQAQDGKSTKFNNNIFQQVVQFMLLEN